MIYIKFIVPFHLNSPWRKLFVFSGSLNIGFDLHATVLNIVVNKFNKPTIRVSLCTTWLLMFLFYENIDPDYIY